MNDAILIQGVKSNSSYVHLLELTFSRHARYCLHHKMDYQVEMRGSDMRGSWEKVYQIQRELQRYKYVFWIDSDAVIWDVAFNLRGCCQQKPIGAVEMPIPFTHLHVGALFFQSCDESRNFVEDWVNKFPGHDPIWEQGAFQELAGGTVHNGNVGVLPSRCNSCDMLGTDCDNPIIKAWHGHTPYGSLLITHELMQKALKERKQPNWIGV